MDTLRPLVMAGAFALMLTACAQNPAMPDGAGHAAHHQSAAAPSAPADRMAMMDAHMQTMREMHDRMSRARTPQERQALMGEHMTLMQEGMALMGGTGPGRMGAIGMGRMGPAGTASGPMDMAARQQMMEKRMEMMQSMMQMMLDRMGPSPAQP